MRVAIVVPFYLNQAWQDLMIKDSLVAGNLYTWHHENPKILPILIQTLPIPKKHLNENNNHGFFYHLGNLGP